MKTIDTLGLRLIPARAGNTYLVAVVTVAPAAHPRSRGEHVAAGINTVVGFGSSPLARGTLGNLCLG